MLRIRGIVAITISPAMRGLMPGSPPMQDLPRGARDPGINPVSII